MKRKVLVLEIISGILFLLTGLFLVMSINISIAIDIKVFISTLLLMSGALIILLNLRGIPIGSTIVLVISLCIFLVALLNPSIYTYTKYYETTYSLSTNDINTSINEITVLVKSSTGSINIDFTDNASLIYRAKFYGWFPSILISTKPSIKYEIDNETLHLIIDSKTLSTDISLSKKYRLKITIESLTGTIDINSIGTRVNKLDISATTGSINIRIENSEVNTLIAETSTGGINIQLINIKPSIEQGTIIITSSTGSIDLKLHNLEGIDLKALTNTGGVNVKAPKNYDVFTKPKVAIVRAEPIKYIITLETSTGNILVDIE